MYQIAFILAVVLAFAAILTYRLYGSRSIEFGIWSVLTWAALVLAILLAADSGALHFLVVWLGID